MAEPPDPALIEAEARHLATWRALRAATPARIGLGRTGDTLPLAPVLAFQADHAQARDAVHTAFDVAAMSAALAPHPTLVVRSAACDRSEYLRRPDLGRRLHAESRAMLAEVASPPCSDCVFVVADGLSAVAASRHASPLLARCLPRLGARAIAPLVIATQARVALGDQIGALLGARLAIMLIGERPGLSVADSLGLYITFDPKTGRRDSERNCISNIHAKGLTYERAADKLVWLVEQALSRQLTGTGLKDEEELSSASLP